MDNEKRSKVLLESYTLMAYPDVLKQNQFKATQREWNRVKTTHPAAKATKHKAAIISWWTQSKKKGTYRERFV